MEATLNIIDISMEEGLEFNRETIKERLAFEFVDYGTLKQEFKNDSTLKPLKDMLSELVTKKNKRAQEMNKRLILLDTLRAGSNKHNHRRFHSLGESTQRDWNLSMAASGSDGSLMAQHDNLKKGNLKLSKAIGEIEQQLKKHIQKETSNSRTTLKADRTDQLSDLKEYRRSMYLQNKYTVSRNEMDLGKRTLNFQRLHQRVIDTQQEYVALVEDIQAKTRTHKKLRSQLVQLKDKESWMTSKILQVKKSSQYIQNYYQIQNYVDSIFKEDYTFIAQKRTSKLDSATNKIIVFYTYHSDLLRQLMEKFQYLTLQRDELAMALSNLTPTLQVQCLDPHIQATQTTLKTAHSKLVGIMSGLLQHYARLPYKVYQPEVFMKLKEACFKQLLKKEQYLRPEDALQVFSNNPSVQKIFRQMDILSRTSSWESIRDLKRKGELIEDRTTQVLDLLCKDATVRFAGIISSMIAMVISITTEFHRMRRRIKHSPCQRPKTPNVITSETQTKSPSRSTKKDDRRLETWCDRPNARKTTTSVKCLKKSIRREKESVYDCVN